MAWKQIPPDRLLDPGDKIRQHFRVDAPDFLPDIVENNLENLVSGVKANFDQFSQAVSSRLPGEEEVKIVDAYWKDKGNFYELTYVYEVQHTSPLIPAMLIPILTNPYVVGAIVGSIVGFLLGIKITDSGTELATGIGIGAVAVGGLVAYMMLNQRDE